MVFELNALFHEPQALVQELPSRGSKGLNKEGRKGRNSSGETERERQRERERERRTMMGLQV
jgi:hypothetical protein